MALTSRRRVKPGAVKRGKRLRPVIKRRVPEAPTRLLSYEEALLSHILKGDGKGRVTEYAPLLNSMVASLSPAMRDMSYRSGISVGRALYRLYSRERRYEWYEESVHDLVGFLERTGHEHITYMVHPDMIEITMHHRKEPNLGASMHTFESGIMSGFLTAAKGGMVHVNEIACANGGSDYCRFVSSDTYLQVDSDLQAVGRLFDYIGKHLHDIERRQAELEHMPEEYYLLSSLPLMDRAYSNEVRSIMLHLGGALGNRIGTAKAGVEKAVELLGLGRLRIGAMRPLRAEVTYDRLRARSEFIANSTAFIDGLLGERARGRIDVEARSVANAYKVALTERKA